ncbi:MAG TPA: hypothetical protein VFP52_04400 [Myxococcales bacterium]|nr:hypothetical protein [Myxococcales bacterium]
MSKPVRIALAALAAALSGCHERGAAFSMPAGYSLARDASEGALGRKQALTLGEDASHAMTALRYQLPAPGALIAIAEAPGARAPITVAIFPEGAREPVASGGAGARVETGVLQPGTWYVVVSQPASEAPRTRVELRTVYRPEDPDGAQQACRTRDSARELEAGKQVEDSVDYSARRRTCWWKVPLTAEGTLTIRFDDRGHNLSAEFVAARGAAERIDPAQGLTRADLPAGDYFVKVYANEAGDAGRYRLNTAFAIADTCKNGGPACSLDGAEELKLPADSRTAEVDYSKSRQFHFYKATLKEKGRLTISFKVLRARRRSNVAAYFMRSQDDGGDRIAGSVTREIDGPGDVYIRVQAKDAGDAGRYAIATIFQPANFIPADVVEIGRNPCVLTVSAGARQGVRAGVGCTVVNAAGQALDSCVVDQTFPNLSKVKPAGVRCNVAPGCKVQITAQ